MALGREDSFVKGKRYSEEQIIRSLGGPDSPLGITSSPKFTRDDLLQGRPPEPSLAAEIRSLQEKIDPKPHIRSYVESLSKIHVGLRTQMDEHTQEWESAYATPKVQYLEKFGKEIENTEAPVHLMKYAEQDPSSIIAKISISPFISPKREALSSKNRQLTNLTNQFVTSQESEMIRQRED